MIAEMNAVNIITLSVCLVVNIQPSLSEVCCTPDQWVADMFLDYGTVFINKDQAAAPKAAYSYINGTVKTAYDYLNQRTYLKLKGTQVSPLIPGPVPSDTTIINDYKIGIQYNIDLDGSCQKSTIENMTKQCVPDEAKLVSTGSLASSWNKVQNYRFTTNDDFPASVDATVIQNIPTKACNPVRAVYFVGSADRGSGTLINLDVLNVVPSILDPSVFSPPPQCKNARFTGKEEKERNTVLQRFFRRGRII
ncbi:uncharacterized protein LOC133190666 [Saccostrea echinata]|uniref:uncharacterized protein LOC133190666 n=1 Tax=Saccostrea echinata TaxID=191078 RepID=UPI002A826B92|nr:uncharacterized protein LOC133190666 [Saccostrea echinata]